MYNRGKNCPYAIRFSVIARNGDTSEICTKEKTKWKINLISTMNFKVKLPW